MSMRIHHHMPRYGCGHHLITAGANTRLVHEILGHRDICNT
ncbi:MAG: tyrosine-type recombinase/integrase [Gammaproteobacteria bacterium]